MEKHLHAHSDSPQSLRASVINRVEDGYQTQPHTGTKLCPERRFPKIKGARVHGKTGHGRHLSHRRDSNLDGATLTERQKGAAVPSSASSSCSYAIMKMAMAIIAGKGPVAGYLIPTPIEPAGGNFHRVGQESLNRRESPDGENRLLPSAQTALCLLC